MPKSKTNLVTKVLGASFAVGAIVVLFLPSQIDGHRGPRINSAAAVGNLRWLDELETRYATERPKRGFVCNLAQLAEGSSTSWSDLPDPRISGTFSGYQFQIRDCAPDVDGTVRRFRIVAIPTLPGITGTVAYYLNESGVVFYSSVESPPLRVH
jgi:hypothetical protein